MKRLSLLVILTITTTLSNLYAQRFCSTFGGTLTEFAYDVLATSDGGFIMAGSTASFGAGSNDMYIVKFDASGNSQWSRTVGGASNEVAYGIDVATNGDYVIAGETNSIGAGGEAYVVRLDASGALLWTLSVGGVGIEFAKEIAATSDNGCAIVGNTDYGFGSGDLYVAKIDSTGTLEWSNSIGTSNTEGGYGIIASSDGNIVTAGRGFPVPGGAQIYVSKFTNAGAVLWSKYYNSHDAGDFFVPADIIEANGGYVISGYCDTSSGANKNSFITKISTSGNLQWVRIVGITGNDNGASIEPTTDGGYLVSGTNFGVTAKAFAFKTDSAGIPAWYIRSNGSGNSYYYGAVELNNGDYLATGNTDAVDGSDIYLVRLDTIGNACCGDYLTANSGLLASSWGNFGTADTGGIVTTGGTAAVGGTSFVLCNSPAGIEDNDLGGQVSLYPNPATGEITIDGLEGFDSITITNTLGDIMYNSSVNANEMKIYLNDYSVGVYFINLHSKDKQITKKLLIE